MRNLKNLDNFTVNSGRKLFKEIKKDRYIKIRKFSNSAYLNDNTYFMNIYFEGYLIIKKVFYSFEFTMDLITDNLIDIQANIPEDLSSILKMVESDFNSEDSKLINKIMSSIINLYSDELEFMNL